MNLQEHYRSLSGEETEILQSNGCKCSDWNRVKVRDGFNPAACINCIFSGDIRLGVYNDSYVDDSGVAIPSGLQNSRLHNCIVGSNVIINNTGDYIANYVIERMVDEYSASVASGRGAIRHHSRIFNCGTIRNVRVGPFSLLEGSMTLNEGSVNSTEADPVYIGSGVIMEHFIVCPGSVIRDSTLIDKCFIGQGCELSKHYSAENSLFFANSAGFHGVACSIFAGPYTVTHHK